MKFEFCRFFSLILFVYNQMIECSKKNRKIMRQNSVEQKKKTPGLQSNPGLALIVLLNNWALGPVVRRPISA